MSQSSEVSVIFKSRQILLEYLQNQNFETTDYEEFSINEVHIMYKNSQLDMLLNEKKGNNEKGNNEKGNNEKGKKVYVKYHMAKTLPRDHINDYIDDLFNLEQVLTKDDILNIVIKQEPNDPLLNIINQIWEQEGIFIIIFNIKRLQFNILKHDYVPQHVILSEEEAKKVNLKFNIKDNKDFPQISRFDPVAQAIGMRPGQICKILRPSKTAIISEYYRYCS